MSEPTVLYDEHDSIAVITLNRPDELNALTNDLVQGVADAIAAASASADVGAIVLRGAGASLTAGYDLSSIEEFSGPTQPDAWDTPYDAPGPEPRPGSWDPVRDYQFMNHNVRRFMSLWECPKPVIAEIAGWAIGGATDLVMCADLLFMADDAHIGYAPSRIYGLPTTMMWIHRLGLEHAKHYLLTGRAIDAPTAHRIGLVSETHPADQLSTATEAEARRLATIPANQLALNKLLINQAYENMGLRTTQVLGSVLDGYMRNTPNVVSGIGALRVTASDRARTSRVRRGSMMPSSHSRAVA